MKSIVGMKLTKRGIMQDRALAETDSAPKCDSCHKDMPGTNRRKMYVARDVHVINNYSTVPVTVGLVTHGANAMRLWSRPNFISVRHKRELGS